MPDWKGFERLAERIARDLRPDATVTWDEHGYPADRRLHPVVRQRP
jgi:hypothetical protein